ncbi:CGNR zinc finger domain-containing protein [Brevibacillus ginsengisoli]|uniref:CGNR zinc finger domain-containing protein n=1 Tax=Brevibacillus ginsengisoli TaxID=363854 RepID=UPI003CEB9FFC
MEHICIDFMNSDWRDWRGSGRREDRLDKESWLAEFLGHWNLTAPLPVDADMRQVLGQLRDRLRAMVEAVVDDQVLNEADVDLLNRVMKRVSAYHRLVPEGKSYRMELVPLGNAWDLVLERIAVSFTQLLAAGDLRRIKICMNEDCRWIFFDESRNRTRRWCDDACCGNLLKVRRFRERQKQKQDNQKI